MLHAHRQEVLFTADEAHRASHPSAPSAGTPLWLDHSCCPFIPHTVGQSRIPGLRGLQSCGQRHGYFRLHARTDVEGNPSADRSHLYLGLLLSSLVDPAVSLKLRQLNLKTQQVHSYVSSRAHSAQPTGAGLRPKPPDRHRPRSVQEFWWSLTRSHASPCWVRCEVQKTFTLSPVADGFIQNMEQPSGTEPTLHLKDRTNRPKKYKITLTKPNLT